MRARLSLREANLWLQKLDQLTLEKLTRKKQENQETVTEVEKEVPSVIVTETDIITEVTEIFPMMTPTNNTARGQKKQTEGFPRTSRKAGMKLREKTGGPKMISNASSTSLAPQSPRSCVSCNCRWIPSSSSLTP